MKRKKLLMQKELTRPSGLTGDDKPYPLRPWEWTLKEFEQFLVNNKFPACTFRDRLARHKEAVIKAMYRGDLVPEAVLADYPDAHAEAMFRHEADTAWARLADLDKQRVIEFQQCVERDNLLPALINGIRRGKIEFWKHYNSYHKCTVSFVINGEQYWAAHYVIGPKYGHFGKYDDGLDEWQLHRGPVGTGAALEPLLRIPHKQVST